MIGPAAPERSGPIIENFIKQTQSALSIGRSRLKLFCPNLIPISVYVNTFRDPPVLKLQFFLDALASLVFKL